MIVNRKYYDLEQGNQDILHKVILESSLCDFNTDLSRYIQREMFRQLYEDTSLSMCGPLKFETLSIKHDGEKWIVTMFALEKREKRNLLYSGS